MAVNNKKAQRHRPHKLVAVEVPVVAADIVTDGKLQLHRRIVGAGLEGFITDRVSLKVEYLNYMLDNGVPPNVGFLVEPNIQTLKLGLNYKF